MRVGVGRRAGRPVLKVDPSEWQLVLSRDDSGITRLRLGYRGVYRDFTLYPGDTVTLQVRDGKVFFEGHAGTIPAGVAVLLPR